MRQIDHIVKNLTLITHLTGASNYSWVHFRDGTKLLLAKSLTFIENMLPSFVRIHKTALINPAYVRDIRPPFRAKTPGTIIIDGQIVLPISRRRWDDVADALQLTTLSDDTSPVVLATEQTPQPGSVQNNRVMQPITLPERLVYCFIKDNRRAQIMQETVAQKWPACVMEVFTSSTSLSDQVARTVARNLPALIIIDARAVGWSVLNTLEFIKTDNRFRQIPVVVFLEEQTGNDVEVCYAAGANSVVRLADQTGFAQAIEQICRYWLSFAKLPIDA